MNQSNYMTIQFTISGRVQGVFFRKHTLTKAQSLHLTGWVRNTPAGSVEGIFEYTSDDQGRRNAQEFMYWLKYVGSPKCRIDGCWFGEEESGMARRFDSFKVVR